MNILKPKITVSELKQNRIGEFSERIMELDEQLDAHHREEITLYRDRMPSNLSILDTDKEVLHWMRKGKKVFLLFNKNELIGFVLLGPSDYRDCVYVSSLVVDKDFRNQGLGPLLMDKALKLYKKQYPKVDMVILGVIVKNRQAVAAYTKMGFKPIDYMMGKTI